jgi:hypothetical protein
MRKLEREMVSAMQRGECRREDNTSLISDGDGYYMVLLHRHCIAKGRKGQRPDRINLCGYNTATTRSRLTALGVPVCCRNGKAMLNGKEIPIHEWIEVKDYE